MQGRDKITCHLEVVRQNNCQVKLYEQAKLIPKRLSFLCGFYNLSIAILDWEFPDFLRVFSSTDVHFLYPSPCFGEVKDDQIITQLCWQGQQGAHCNLPTG